MIYIRGDTHGEEGQFCDEVMPGQSQWTAEDILIVTGDFGFVFFGEKRYLSERNRLDALARKPYQILFVDGNHEGFPYLLSYPEEIRFGAPVRRIRDNIFWLQRGYVYEIGGHSFFVMGGAYSMDKAFRLNWSQLHGEQAWFREELPSAEEYRRAAENLRAREMTVDYILTHTAPRSVIGRIIHAAPDMNDSELTGFLDWVWFGAKFKHWYFGHFHEDMELNDQLSACFTQLRQIP